MMSRMLRNMRRQGLAIPPDNFEPLKRMLAIGILVYLKLPLPDCMTSVEDGIDTTKVQAWSVSTKHNTPKQYKKPV